MSSDELRFALSKSALWRAAGKRDDFAADACEDYLRAYKRKILLHKIANNDDKREVYLLFHTMFSDAADNVEILELIDSGIFVLADPEDEDPPFMVRTRCKWGNKKLWGKAP